MPREVTSDMHPLSLLSDRLAVARLAADAPVPEWCGTRPFLVVSRTGEELSIVCPEERVPPSIQAERGFRAFALYLEAHPEMHGRIGMLARAEEMEQPGPGDGEGEG